MQFQQPGVKGWTQKVDVLPREQRLTQYTSCYMQQELKSMDYHNSK